MAPFDGAGNFALPPGSIVSDGTTIDASDHNVPTTDIAAALSQVLLRSGVAPMTGDLDMGGNDLINVGSSGSALLTEDDTGTSGHKLPYLDVANTWQAAQTFEHDLIVKRNSVIGDEATDNVVIKGTTVNAEVTNQMGATWAGFGTSLLNALLISRVIAAGDVLVFRQQHSGFNWGYTSPTGMVTAGLLGLPNI